MKKFVNLVLSLILLMITAASFDAFADGTSAPHEPMANNMAACKGDLEKFCKDVKPGGGRMAECLKNNQAQLSAGCKAQAEKMKEKFKAKFEEIKSACKSDVETLCKGVQPGEGRLFKCLKANESKVSPGCKAAFSPGAQK